MDIASLHKFKGFGCDFRRAECLEAKAGLHQAFSLAGAAAIAGPFPDHIADLRRKSISVALETIRSGAIQFYNAPKGGTA
jgi:hypothetical protein